MNPADQPDLNSVQRWMLSVITHPDGIDAGADAEMSRRWIQCGPDNLESVVSRSNNLSAGERLAVYGNAYIARLLDCLAEVYPVLAKTLGEEVFQGFAFGYLQDYPSRSYTLHHLGRDFVRYLRETQPDFGEDDADGKSWSDFLIDLAELEWAIYDAFDDEGLEDRPELKMPDALVSGEGEWLDLVFRTAPCLRLLKLDHAVNDYYTAARKAGDEVPELPATNPGEHYLAISRRDFIVRRYPLTRAQFLLLGSLAKGNSLGDALEHMLDSINGEDVASQLPELLPEWFRNWAAQRCFFYVIE